MQSVNLSEDRHAHAAIWLLARVNNLIHGSKTSSSSLEKENCTRLMSDLAAWEQIGANTTRPVMQLDADHHMDEPFPRVLFSSESSMIAHIMWHTAIVLLVDSKPEYWALRHDGLSTNVYEHAQAACGIIETNNHSSCVLVDALHPLWICGRHMKTKSEKFAVLELLAQIERKTGWKTSWRADSLREMWNLS